MTLQEQIEKYRIIAQNAPYSGMAWEIIRKQSEMLKVAKVALAVARDDFHHLECYNERKEVVKALATIEEMELLWQN